MPREHFSKPGQPRLIREPVVTTSLMTGRTEARIRRRKSIPGSESNFEMTQRANTWWNEEGRQAFHQSLKGWTFRQSDRLREVGESTEYGMNVLEESEATEQLIQALKAAKKLRINPLYIVTRIKKYGIELKQARAKESFLLEDYYPEVASHMSEVFDLTPSRLETFMGIFRYQKALEATQP